MALGAVQPPPAGRRELELPRRRRATWALAALAIGALTALPLLTLSPQPADLSTARKGEAEAPTVFSTALSSAFSDVKPLQDSVEAGQLVSRFGDKCGALLAKVESSSPELAPAVSGALHALFLKQLALLRQQIAAKTETGARPLEMVAQADSQFVAKAQELKMPGSDWDFEPERYALRAVLEGVLRRDAALIEARQRGAQSQQATVEIISKLQSQMEALQQKVQAMKAGAPWFLSGSYRIPKTPFQLIFRYQQGRPNLELSLNADKDPANTEAGFVDGLGPPNVGVSLNVGM